MPDAIVERIASEVVDSALKVHRELGPGLVESAYQACLAHVLASRGINVRTEVILPITFQGVELKSQFRIDMIVEGCILIENKAVQQIIPVHVAQILTYLKQSGIHLGFLINWNVPRIKDGLKRVING